jgi:hypothetical protein
MKIKHTFKGSKGSHGYGYFAFIDGDTNELVIGESWPHEGGEIFRGTWAQIKKSTLEELRKEAPELYISITSYPWYLAESSKVNLSCLRFGDKFCYNGYKYMVIDMNISSCFISTAGNESSIICALDLESYKVFCFDKTLQIEPLVE